MVLYVSLYWGNVDQLLLLCEIAYVLWSFFRMFGVLLVVPSKMDYLLFGWRNWFGKHSLDIWDLTLLCLIWLVWKEHNSLTFEDREGLLDQLKSLLICTLFDWSHVWGFTHCNYIFEFQQSLFFCLIYCNLLDILCSFSSTWSSFSLSIKLYYS